MRVIAQPGMTVKLAPLGAHDLGEPRPCFVHHDPDSLAPWCVAADADGEHYTADSRAALVELASRLGLVVEPSLYVP